MANEERMRIAVTITDNGLRRLQEIKDALRAAGMDIEQSFDEMGVISGSVHPSKFAALQEVPGVIAVEPEHGNQVPPPDSPIQ